MAGKNKKPFYPNTVAKAGNNNRRPDSGPKSVLIDSLIGDFVIPLGTAFAAGVTGNKKLKEKASANIKKKSAKIKRDAEARAQTAKLDKIQKGQASKYSTAKKKAGGKLAAKKKQSGLNRLY